MIRRDLQVLRRCPCLPLQEQFRTRPGLTDPSHLLDFAVAQLRGDYVAFPQVFDLFPLA